MVKYLSNLHITAHFVTVCFLIAIFIAVLLVLKKTVALKTPCHCNIIETFKHCGKHKKKEDVVEPFGTHKEHKKIKKIHSTKKHSRR